MAVVAILALLALSLYLGFYANSPKPSTIISTSTLVSPVTIVAPTTRIVTETTSLTTTRVVTSTLQGIIPPINNVLISNISLPYYPWAVAVNNRTNMIYSAAPLANLTIINGTTDRIASSLNIGIQGSNYVAVNPATNLVYAASDIIDGASNKIVGNLHYNLTGVAVNSKTNILFAIAQDKALTGNTTLLVISGENNSLIKSYLLNGTADSITINSATQVVYVPICTTSTVCSPIYLLAVNGTTYQISSKILIDSDQSAGIPFAVIADPATNMVYMTDRELVSVNGTTDRVVAKTIVSAFTIQCRGVAVNSKYNEIYVTGWGIGNYGSFFIVNGQNYSLLNAFAGTGQPVGVAFDPRNMEIYVANSQTKSVLALNSTAFVVP